jgi:hypothetical protein
MSEWNYTTKRDNFLGYVLELRKLVSRIHEHRENLKDDFENLHQVIEKIKFLVGNVHKEQNK